MRKEKLRKVGLCVVSCYFSSSFAVQFWLFDIRDFQRGNWERQIARNGKLNIYLKINYNLLVMNVTQLNFLN